jgi:hypothetical protein
MEFPRLVPIEYHGQLVALVSTRRIHVIAPWLLASPAGDPDLRFVAYMCICCAEVLNGRLAGPYTEELGVRWARAALRASVGAAGRSAQTPPETTSRD